MSETLNIGDVFPVMSFEALKANGLEYWEQRISTPLGTFLYDTENEWRDGNSRWISENGQISVTIRDSDNTITEIYS